MPALFKKIIYLVLGLSSLAVAAEPPQIRVGVLGFGTVNWELDVMVRHALAKKHGVDLVVVPLASGDASTIALQGGSVDVIVSDWLWVSRQRADAKLFSFVTYSNAVGSVIVDKDSPIKTLADLKGKKIGVSGGASDKIWLLLRAHSQRNLGADVARSAVPTYGAPPLLNELMQRQQLDAVLNTWAYTARLEARGMRRLIELPEILAGLGVKQAIPLIGWVFREDWAAKNQDALNAFFSASTEAKQIMLRSDDEWLALKPKMKAESEAIFTSLRDKFRAGIPACGPDPMADISLTYQVLADIGGEKLVGKATQLAKNTFWPAYRPSCSKP
jgi:NitT/TauT family transport system substrate-binding protein